MARDPNDMTSEEIRERVGAGRHYEAPGQDSYNGDGRLPSGAWIDTGEAFTPPDWLVKDMVLRRGTGLIIGQRGAAKTAIAIGLGTAIATATAFFGRKVKAACGVIYFAAEGAGQIRFRMRVASRHLGIDGEIPLACIDKPHNLSDATERVAFIELCNETAAWLKARFGVETCLLMIDTAIKAFAIEDENDNAEIAAVCKLLEQISRATGCFVFVVVHAGKNIAAGARGASAWLDNVDIALFVSGERDEVKGTCKDRALSQTKNRDGPEGPISGFDLRFMKLGEDADDGEPFGAMAIETNDKPVSDGSKRKPTDAEIIFEKAFNELAIRKPHRIAVGSFKLMAFTQDALREEFYRLYVPGKEGGEELNMDAKRAAWTRAMKSIFLLSQYPRENRNGIGWIWSIDEPREAWNAKERNERALF